MKNHRKDQSIKLPILNARKVLCSFEVEHAVVLVLVRIVMVICENVKSHTKKEKEESNRDKLEVRKKEFKNGDQDISIFPS